MPRHRDYASMPLTGETAACIGENKFRATVRNILDLSWDTRNEAIYDELRRLKAIEANRR